MFGGVATLMCGWALGLVVLSPAIRLPEVTQLDGGDGSLRGLPGVAVVVEQLPFDVRATGLSEDGLERAVAGALRRDSVLVLTRSDAGALPRTPYLVTRLESVRLPLRDAYAWHLSLGLHQNVTVAGADPVPRLAITWEATATIGANNGEDLRRAVERALAEQVGQFVRAWAGRDRAAEGHDGTPEGRHGAR